MSSYSFSPQFYQHWTCAPEPIRAAITQELKDITTLLQPETVFESFVFNTHDLDAHVDELYDNYDAEQAIAKAIADKQAQARAAAEKQRLEEEKQKEAEDAKLKAEAKLHEEATKKEKERNEQLAIDKENTEVKISAIDVDKQSVSDRANEVNVSNITAGFDSNSEKLAAETVSNEIRINDNKSSDGKTLGEQAHALSDHHIKDIHHNASTAINLVLKDTKLDATHEQLIRELEIQVDDYLSEQMMLMSENLKSWLRAEVTQHLSEQDGSATHEETAPKNIH